MINIAFNQSLASIHSFQLPGNAAEVRTIEDAEDCERLPHDDYYVLGAGSNTLFTTNFTKPLVINRITGIQIEAQPAGYDVCVGAGEDWHGLVCHLLANEIYGLENLALIPGTVGAAPVQNIGAYGREVADFVVAVKAWNREQQVFELIKAAECDFSYRDSLFKRHPERWLITHVYFYFPNKWLPICDYGELKELGPEASPQAIFDRVVEVRKAKLPDPKVIPNAGSFFKNPIISQSHYQELVQQFPSMPHFRIGTDQVKVAAGWLIDQLGFKGYQLGGAAVHQRQALVLTNNGTAKGADVVRLAETIQQAVLRTYQITLEVEVRIMGSDDLLEL